MTAKVEKSDEQWRDELSPERTLIARQTVASLLAALNRMVAVSARNGEVRANP